jgi:hypothetical protein
MRAALEAFLLLMGAACSADQSRHTSVTRATVGDTAIVRTTGAGLWGDSVALLPEVRIGLGDGADPYVFGRIEQLAVGPDGDIYVFDASVPVLRRYDSAGRFVGAIGRAGAGPGEYRDASGLGVTRAGTVLLYDVGNARIDRYSRTGDPQPAWPVGAQYYTGQAFVLDTSGGAYVKVLLSNPRLDEEWETGYVHVDSGGLMRDTIAAPTHRRVSRRGRMQLDPSYEWTVDALGQAVGGFNAGYPFEVSGSGKVTRIGRDAGRIRFAPEEHSQLTALFNYRQPGTSPPPPTAVPEYKVAWERISPMPDGRFWVRVSVPSVHLAADEIFRDARDPARPPVSWRMPSAYDVFERDGTFLGQVTFPGRAVVAHADGKHAWVVAAGPEDEPVVVRYRVVPSRR